LALAYASYVTFEEEFTEDRDELVSEWLTETVVLDLLSTRDWGREVVLVTPTERVWFLVSAIVEKFCLVLF
jgi:hypothetical protein